MGFVGKTISKITGADKAAQGQQQAAATQAASAQEAAQLQRLSAQEATAEQRRQFDISTGLQKDAQARAEALQTQRFDEFAELMNPYITAGETALGGLQDILGVGGAEAQQAAITGIEQSPQFTSLVDAGEEAILQRASATGGLRGGNVQGALAQFRPSILSDLINQQYSRLGGLAQIGQQSAGAVGGAGINTGQNIAQQGTQSAANLANLGGQFATNIGNISQQSAAAQGNLLQQGAAARAAGQVAAGGAQRQGFGDLLSIGGAIGGFF